MTFRNTIKGACDEIVTIVVVGVVVVIVIVVVVVMMVGGNRRGRCNLLKTLVDLNFSGGIKMF